MSGSYISEVYYTGPIVSDFIEVAVPVGTDVSGWTVSVYNTGGQSLLSLPFGAAEGAMVGHDVYLFDKSTSGFPSLSENISIALVDGDGNTLQFISLYEPAPTAIDGPAAGETPTFVGVTAANGESVQSTDHGATYATEPVPNGGTIPCFAAGTRILTPSGERCIETLAVGDKILSARGQTYTIRWMQSRAVCYRDTPKAPKPIHISANALGKGRPRRDLVVSVQHRIAMGGFGQGEALFMEPVLAPAVSLTKLKGVRVMSGKKQVVWFHIALDTHELVLAEGCVAESLFFGPVFLANLTRREALGLRRTLPHRFQGDSPLLPVLSVGEVKSVIGASRSRPGCFA